MFWDNASERAADKEYNRQLKIRKIKWDGQRNVWAMKLDQYEIDTDEAVLASSRQAGAIQRDFGLEGTKFREDNKALYQQLAATLPVNEGDTARRYGRSKVLQGLYKEGMMESNMRRKGIEQSENMQKVGRTLLTAHNQALAKRGFAPIPDAAPAKPTKRKWYERALDTASTVASLGSSYSSWSKS